MRIVSWGNLQATELAGNKGRGGNLLETKQLYTRQVNNHDQTSGKESIQPAKLNKEGRKPKIEQKLLMRLPTLFFRWICLCIWPFTNNHHQAKGKCGTSSELRKRNSTSASSSQSFSRVCSAPVLVFFSSSIFRPLLWLGS